MSFQTRHGEPISRILAAYQQGPGLIAALETYVKTAEANAKTEVRDDFAERVCEGLHRDKAAGLKCMKCYLAEQHFNQEAVVLAEIESGRDEPTEPPD